MSLVSSSRRRVLGLLTAAVTALIALGSATPAMAADPTGWTPALTISDTSFHIDDPQLVAAPNGTFAVIWNKTYLVGATEYRSIEATVSRDNGATWTTPVTLTPANVVADDPNLTVTGNGTFAASWVIDDPTVQANPGRIIQASSSLDDGATWSAAVDLANVAAPAEVDDTDLAGGAGGLVSVVWTYNNGVTANPGTNIAELQSKTSTDGGVTWGSTVVIAQTQTSTSNFEVTIDGPQITATSLGAIGISWTSSLTDETVPLTPISTTDANVSTSTDAGATFTTTQLTNATNGQEAGDVDINRSGDGTLVVIGTWNDGATPANVSVWTSASANSGVTWSALANVAGPSVETQYEYGDPQIAGGAGNIFAAVWTRTNPNVTESVIVQSAVTTNGTAAWGATTSHTAEVANQAANEPKVAISSSGMITVAWVLSTDPINQQVNGMQGQVQATTSTTNGSAWSATENVSTQGIEAYDLQIAATPSGWFALVWAVAQANNGNAYAQVSVLGPKVLAATGANASGILIAGILVLAAGAAIAIVGVRARRR